ncbi:MAG: 1-acyl-sn-glycerol-3-phosphate acyltransferase [Candidatus Sericytochromatia bacterium]|nr:1-acyl-sn-glycerol-3-phosphate acyltransferase [Candidatus Sericytochromatia bacterium]
MSATQGRIFTFNQEREAILQEVVQRRVVAHGREPEQLRLALNDAAFTEITRIEDAGQTDGRAYGHWRELYRRLGRLDGTGLEAELARLLWHYAKEVVGNFDPRVYALATRVVPPALSFLWRPQLNWSRLLNLSTARERIQVQGPVDRIRKLARKGTLILVPTHLSNLDSLVIGFSLLTQDLPPFTYGAGKNLFFNPFISYFMHNLGAYKVDRRLRFGLYKEVLKTYSQVLLERGYHSLFFPGGTRSRSGEVERRLKLGLLGTAYGAATRRLLAGATEPDIWVVPCTLNYPIVLEAESLIEDHLKREGQHRYLASDDESGRLGRILSYGRQVTRLDATMVVQFGPPMDLWGHAVDDDGISHDARGRSVATRSYLCRRGQPYEDEQRDREYTEELGQALVDSFHRHTVAVVTQVTAHAAWRMLEARHPDADVYGLLRLAQGAVLAESDLLAALEHERRHWLAEAEAGRIKLGRRVQTGPSSAILAAALDSFGMYHRRAALARGAEGIMVEDPKLLLYYRNRLTGHDPAPRPRFEVSSSAEDASRAR